jgi:WD40 repeat protein
MTDTRAATVSITDRVRPVAAGAPVVAVYFLKQTAAFVLGEETALLVSPDGNERRVCVHTGAILSAASDGERLITGGDDGKVVAIDADGGTTTIATDDKRRWIDHVATGPNGTVAWSAGKTAYARAAKGATRALDVVSTVGGLAFAPKGFRLAIAHYNGATLWFPNVQSPPEVLDWKGSHLGVWFSPDGKYLITTMQEPTLHGWRLADRQHMRMSGYAARVRSLDWTAGGAFLASSGSDQLILWPFQTKDGPTGKPPKMLAPHKAALAVVACHPRQQVVAAGFADGLTMLVRVDDGAEILAKRPGAAPVTALAWRADGGALAFGCEDGEAGILDF